MNHLLVCIIQSNTFKIFSWILISRITIDFQLNYFIYYYTHTWYNMFLQTTNLNAILFSKILSDRLVAIKNDLYIINIFEIPMWILV